MIAIDTNVLVRLLTADDAAQTRRAAALFEQGDIFLPKTVLLETEWVLRFSYQLSRPTIVTALKNVLGLAQVKVEDGFTLAAALTLFESGMDFADALHLASSRDAAQFATFDTQLKKRADRDAPNHSVILL
jgi:predicted nucleic-acid-binding protein